MVYIPEIKFYYLAMGFIKNHYYITNWTRQMLIWQYKLFFTGFDNKLTSSSQTYQIYTIKFIKISQETSETREFYTYFRLYFIISLLSAHKIIHSLEFITVLTYLDRYCLIWSHQVIIKFLRFKHTV